MTKDIDKVSETINKLARVVVIAVVWSVISQVIK
jgi:hypothetical protein